VRADYFGLVEPTVPTQTGHIRWSEMSVELEAVEMLYALVRCQKPFCVVEDGTGAGVGTLAMYRAICDNGVGSIYTYEPMEEYFQLMENTFQDLPNLTLTHGRASLDHKDLPAPDFVFVDTGGGHEVRGPEIEFWLKHENNPMVVVHDSVRRYPEFELGEGIFINGFDGLWVGRGKV